MSQPSFDELLDEFSEVMDDGVPVVSAGDSYCVDDFLDKGRDIANHADQIVEECRKNR